MLGVFTLCVPQLSDCTAFVKNLTACFPDGTRQVLISNLCFKFMIPVLKIIG